MSLLVLLGLIALLLGLCGRYTGSSRGVRRVGSLGGRLGRQNGGFMAERNAYLKDWRCPACGYSAWVKSF